MAAVVTACSIISTCSGISITVDPEYTVYAGAAFCRKDAVYLSLDGTVPAGSRKYVISPDSRGIADITAAAADFAGKSRTPYLVEINFSADASGEVYLGVGACYFAEAFIDGHPVYSMLYQGNESIDFRPENNPFKVLVRKGKNRIVFLLHSAAAGGLISFGQVDAAAAEKYFSHTSYLTHGNPGSVCVNFFSGSPAMAFVDYRKKGERTSRRAYDISGGQMRCDRTKHTVLLTGLESDTEYEYRTGIIRFPETGLYRYELFDQPQTIYLEKAGFRTFTCAPTKFSMFYTSDIHGMPAQRITLLNDFLKNCRAGDADILVSGGDIGKELYDSERVLLHSLTDVLFTGCKKKPVFVSVRGNHEYRGFESADFQRFFGGKEEKTYYMFRMGEVCFIVLDSGEDKPRQKNFAYYARHFDRELMLEQRKWLEKAVTDEMFTGAKFKVVMIHSAGEQKYMRENISVITDGLFTGKDPAHKIHLWLCGHTHHFSRSVSPDGRDVMAQEDIAVRNTGALFSGHGVVLVGGGPAGNKHNNTGSMISFSENAIKIQSAGRDGKVFDSFYIMPDGTVKEDFSSLKLVRASQ